MLCLLRRKSLAVCIIVGAEFWRTTPVRNWTARIRLLAPSTHARAQYQSHNIHEKRITALFHRVPTGAAQDQIFHEIRKGTYWSTHFAHQEKAAFRLQVELNDVKQQIGVSSRVSQLWTNYHFNRFDLRNVIMNAKNSRELKWGCTSGRRSARLQSSWLQHVNWQDLSISQRGREKMLESAYWTDTLPGMATFKAMFRLRLSITGGM
jgi:hypothetical protein